MRLIDLQSGQPINITDRVVTFDGYIGKIVDGRPPTNDGETGRVFVVIDGSSFQREMEPTVIGAKWTNDFEAT